LTPTAKNTVEPKTKAEIIAAIKKDWHSFTDIEKRQFLVKFICKIHVVSHPIKGKREGQCEVTEIIFNS
jgi:hypothetical protein